MITIRYSIVDCNLGRMLLAATERGLCAVSLDAEDAPLLAFLHHEFPAASLDCDDASLSEWANRIVRYLSGEEIELDVPTDANATEFQTQVWHELRKIPRGTTRSYRDVARALGKPSAVRAVARACATNPVAIVVPCHRVVKTDGTLAGYRWGIERKRALLEQESGRPRLF